MKNKSIRSKLLLSFIAVMLLTIPVSLYTISATYQIKHNFTDIVDFSITRLNALLEMQMAAQRVTAFINNFNNEIESMPINENTPTKIGATKDKMLARLGEIEEWQKIYKSHITSSEKIIDLKELTELHDKVVLASLASFNAKEKNLSEAEQISLREKLELSQKNLERFIKSSIITESDILSRKKAEALHTTEKTFIITLLLNAGILIIAILISLVLTGLISKPIIRLKNFASSINQDNLDHRFPITNNDEIGELAESVNTMLETLLQSKINLLEASRAAGVAEVATSILHNVGNVLNSINVSTAIMSETMQQLKPEELKQLHDLLLEHKDTLSEYIKNDENGKLIIPYIQEYAKKLTVETASLKTELDRLAVNLQHVNNVIAMQQSYGRSKGLVELTSISELIDTTCALMTNKLIQASITIIRDFAILPPIATVKAKVQQILINLITNSIDSLSASKNIDRKIIIKLIKIENKIQISVIDNGVGIRNENLTKIFSFGFTTKKEGHGYGVHNSALLASELGGELRVMSEGQDKGATFILEISNEEASLYKND